MLQKISEGEGARERELNSTEFLACDISEQNKGIFTASGVSRVSFSFFFSFFFLFCSTTTSFILLIL